MGLVVSQFLAAFNDQAIHFVATFYAINLMVSYARVPGLGENTIISLVTACFILPFFLFSPLAGMLADKYSKRNILVFWKLAEVGITTLALVGFLLPHVAALGWGDPKTLAVWSAGLLICCVFLMGTHSAFFIPAKYGVMPEILQHTILSRGNGFLEGTSFVATVFGSVLGGVLYYLLKSKVTDEAALQLGREWLIGAILLSLAVIGAACSLLIERMPAAAPNQPLTWKLWRPLAHNVGMLLRSRPLALAVIGIAFFAFITLYARQTLIYDGEIRKDLDQANLHLARLQEEAPTQPDADGHEVEHATAILHPGATRKERAELGVVLLFALVGLGIGIGNLMAGYFSGHKVELGLVPIGAFFLIVCAIVLALTVTKSTGATIVCLVLLGVAAGFYIVPLYTLLQHRAPKDSKGNLVATSNFINVIGGLLAVGIFYLVTSGLELRAQLPGPPDIQDPNYLVLLQAYRDGLLKKQQFTSILFLTAAMMTALMILVLGQQLPDFFTRTLLWLRSLKRYRLHVVGLNNLPSDGPVILATNCERPEGCLQVLTATDRYIRFVLVEAQGEPRLGPLLRFLVRRTHLAVLRPGKVGDAVLERTLADAVAVLQRGEMVGLPAASNHVQFDVHEFLRKLQTQIPTAQLLPVYCGPDRNGKAEGEEAGKEAAQSDRKGGRQEVFVVIGRPLLVDLPAEQIRGRIHSLGEWIHFLQRKGPVVEATTGAIPEA
jgi:acyl-[acyl-carrier-protein]-phospholipid O-acyltransferase/long-chain-fatty-acid--[acyl-carrier-protein] ligase